MSSGNDGLSYRTDPAPGERIDRGRTLRFTFDGKSLNGHDGDTIASALAATGITVLSRSFKYHRPRGLLCCSGACPNCLVQVEKEPNVRACVRRSGITSPTITHAAPSRWHEAAHARPTGPAPAT